MNIVLRPVKYVQIAAPKKDLIWINSKHCYISSVDNECNFVRISIGAAVHLSTWRSMMFVFSVVLFRDPIGSKLQVWLLSAT